MDLLPNLKLSTVLFLGWFIAVILHIIADNIGPIIDFLKGIVIG